MEATVATIEMIRKEFPSLFQEVNGSPLVYLDNGATTQKPQSVIDAVSRYYEKENSNIHRGVHTLSQNATTAYEDARNKISRFINSPTNEQVIFTSGTTESINLVTNTWGRKFLNAGDEVIISTMEHHSNIVPWQMICEERGAILKVIEITDAGELEMENYKSLLSDKTKMVAVTHVSNSLGTVNPVEKIIELAHEKGAKVLLDGAQAIAHFPVDVQALDCDFYVFSGHKMYGPTGTGILFGKEEILNSIPPYKGGGDMIKIVTFEKTTYNELPHKLEAGTPNIAGGIGLGVAVDFITEIGFDTIIKYEQELLAYATEKLLEIEGLRLIGTASKKEGILSMVIEGVHSYDLGTLLDQMGIAIRTGHHCTQPLMQRFGISGTARASLTIYNTKEDIDKLVAGITRAVNMLR